MEGYLRIGLLLIAGVIISLIIFESWYRKRLLKGVKAFEDLSTAFQVKMKEPSATGTYSTPQPTARVLSAPTQQQTTSEPVVRQEPTMLNNLLVMSVVARPGAHFGSYDLLQAISSTGMQFGEMNIFHYYEQTPGRKVPLFSLASATEPGEFDINRMGEYSCSGLTLFMDMNKVSRPMDVVEMMIRAAEQLAEDLDGEIRAGQRMPWTNDTLQTYRQKAANFAFNHA